MARPQIDDPLAWKKISPQDLVDHILEEHLLNSWVMSKYGVPRCDIEICSYRGIYLQDVIAGLYAKLPLINRKNLNNVIYLNRTWGDLIGISVKYMESLRLAEVNSQEISKLIPNFPSLELVINKSTTPDISFTPTKKGDRSAFDEFCEEVIENPQKIILTNN